MVRGRRLRRPQQPCATALAEIGPPARVPAMFQRQRTGSVVCPSCGRLVGVADRECLSCGRRNPGMWGLTGALRGLGRDLGFVQLVLGGSILLYAAMLAWDVQGIGGGGNLLALLSPSQRSLL